MPNYLKKIGGWTPVIDQLTANPKYKLPGAAVVGAVLRHCMMHKGYCNASQQTLADELGLCRKTVNIHLKQSVEDGIFEDLTPDIRNIPHIYRYSGKLNTTTTEINLDNSTLKGVTLGDTGVTDGVTVSYPNILGYIGDGEKIPINGMQKSHSSPSAFAEDKNQSSAHADKPFNGDYPKIIQDIKVITNLYPPKDQWEFLNSKFPDGITDMEKATIYYRYARSKHISPFSYGVWLIEWYSTDGYYLHPKDKAKIYKLFGDSKPDDEENESMAPAE